MKPLIIISIFLCFVSSICLSQTINGPQWSSSSVGFESAKIRTLDQKTKKYGAEVYKTSYVSIDNANSYPTFTIDIPDKFYIKSMTCNTEEYRLETLNNTIVTKYVIEDGDKWAFISFQWEVGSKTPTFITITATDNIKRKPMLTVSFMLTEFK
ncbi:MAG: hypothetical protein ABIT05_00295 [Chitinophagaceae bacterium]